MKKRHIEFTAEQVAKIKELRRQGQSEYSIACAMGVSRSVIHRFLENPTDFLPQQLIEKPGYETKLPQFSEEGDIPINYERCITYRGRLGCRGLKQIGAECLPCRDKWLQLANEDWEQFMDALAGPVLTSPLTPDPLPPPPPPILIEEHQFTLHDNPEYGRTRVVPSPSRPIDNKEEVDKIIEEVRQENRNRLAKRRNRRK